MSPEGLEDLPFVVIHSWEAHIAWGRRTEAARLVSDERRQVRMSAAARAGRPRFTRDALGRLQEST